MLEERRKQLRNNILGSDAKVGSSSFIDTQDGYGVTSHRALELTTKKVSHDLKMPDRQEH